MNAPVFPPLFPTAKQQRVGTIALMKCRRSPWQIHEQPLLKDTMTNQTTNHSQRWWRAF